MVFAGSAPTFPWQLFAVICVGMSTGHVPVFRSVVAASMEPLKRDTCGCRDGLSVGQTLSSIIMGTVFTVTIATLPQMVFYVHGVFIILGAFILFFIKDSDRYEISDNQGQDECTLGSVVFGFMRLCVSKPLAE
ncbi:hypothetical protein BJ138DRAFT_115895 [Hygrophoropsis aurantiaca]|uniref:Uncharacterized protein n=1 Tax=Hygrophoropsis aurantiaca TaxID=72124 RepID=A0ACB7ZRP4_9AGAM|nr:hypothetical protein BJ138DRAFT_115895 [Hygrophoropsis aurantiaca]